MRPAIGDQVFKLQAGQLRGVLGSEYRESSCSNGDARNFHIDPRDRRLTGRVHIEPNVFLREGRRVRYGVTDNYGDFPAGTFVTSPPGHAPARSGSDGKVRSKLRMITSAGSTEELFAINIHGFFAGGGMYWQESRVLAEGLGWRLVAPSLPGFGGSDPLPWAKVDIYELANEIAALMDHLGVGRALLLGHSMGGAVAVAFAQQYPERTLGIVYRDGAATPAWRHRTGLLVNAVKPLAPDIAGILDLGLGLAADLPDLLVGRRRADTLKRLIPDFRRNVRSIGRTIPVGAMLFTIDMTGDVAELGSQGKIPLLPVWGCFDKVANPSTAEEFEEASSRKVMWVPGGHSWMLARPTAQLDVLVRTARGRAFVGQVLARQAELGEAQSKSP